jgi:peptide-methionine (S)-S-oxide reductase
MFDSGLELYGSALINFVPSQETVMIFFRSGVSRFRKGLWLPLVVVLLPMTACGGEPAVVLPPPAVNAPASNSTHETVVFAGGCFWGVQAVFEHVKGVQQAVSGYAGGAQTTAHYEEVGSGETGHAESVRVEFNPQEVSFGELLRVYFSVAHNPTELNHQGPDTGTQYRSEIFFTSSAQQKVAVAYIAQLEKAAVFRRAIVTQVKPLTAFYPAEGYHQDYAVLHPDNAYIAYNDLPKVENLRHLFPVIYREQPVRVLGH